MMPRGDRTGPEGMGPRTGRAAGFCAGYDVPGYANARVGWGLGGSRRGHRHWFYATGLPGWLRGRGLPVGDAPLPPEDVASLREHGQALRRTLNEIEERIRAMEAGAK
ncbi:MAG: DUF5320 domain-containing protein [Anaerolineae bacterium]